MKKRALIFSLVAGSILAIFLWQRAELSSQLESELESMENDLLTTTVVSIEAQPEHVSVGQTITVSVSIDGLMANLSSFQVDLTYDSSIIEYIASYPGDFLKLGQRNLLCPPVARKNPSTIRQACATAGIASGASGSGELVAFTFRALGGGTSPLSLSNLVLSDDQRPPVIIEATLADGSVVVADNSAPVAYGDTYTTTEDSILSIVSPGVLSNDEDVDGDPLSAILEIPPTHGLLQLSLDGAFTYTPTLNFYGIDTFTYHATDGTAASNTSAVTLTVTAQNDSPLAVGDFYTTAEDTPVIQPAPGVLSNDEDVDGDSLEALLDGGPANGELSLSPSGAFVYTPALNFNGQDFFTYHAHDGLLASNTVPVSITITAAPVISYYIYIPFVTSTASSTNEQRGGGDLGDEVASWIRENEPMQPWARGENRGNRAASWLAAFMGALLFVKALQPKTAFGKSWSRTMICSKRKIPKVRMLKIVSIIVVMNLVLSAAAPVVSSQEQPESSFQANQIDPKSIHEGQGDWESGTNDFTGDSQVNKDRRLLKGYQLEGSYWADLDGDHDVDSADLALIAELWDCAAGESCYLSDHDYDSNDVIDAHDLAWVGNEYDVTPPQISVVTPTEDEVVGSLNVTVTGLVTDTHSVISATVNGLPASLAGSEFTANIPLDSGNHTLVIVAEDELGQLGIASRVVFVDGEGPIIKIQHPKDRQSVYTQTPTVAISFKDFNTEIDPASFGALLVDEGGATIDITSDISVFQQGAEGVVGTPLIGDTSYTLTVSLNDVFGNSSSTSISFYVPTNAGNIETPHEPDGAGWVSGVVYNSSTCDNFLTSCQGLPGAMVTLAYSGGVPYTGTIVTGPDGLFAFPVAETGHYWLRVEKENFTYGQRAAQVVRRRSAATNEIYLTPIDPALTLCDESGCSHVSSDGTLEVEIPAGAIAPGVVVTTTATNFENVEFLPSGELPPGTAETYAFNLGGDSDISFTVPITVRQQNDLGFDPGTQIPLGYWNQETLEWEHKGFGVVDPTGQWVEASLTGFSNYDLNLPAALPDVDLTIDIENETANDDQSEDQCPESESGCMVHLRSGELTEDYQLAPVKVLDEPAAPLLFYSTSRANPVEIIDLNVSLSTPDEGYWKHYGKFELYIEGEKTDSFWFAISSLLSSGGRLRYLWDGRDAQGNELPPGVYDFRADLQVYFVTQYCGTLYFGGPPDCENLPTGITVIFQLGGPTWGTIELDPGQDSPWGSGWALAGQQRLYEDEAGHILIADGVRKDAFSFPQKNLLGDGGRGNTELPADFLDFYASVISAPTGEEAFRITAPQTDTGGDQGLATDLSRVGDLDRRDRAESTQTSESADLSKHDTALETGAMVPDIAAPLIESLRPYGEVPSLHGVQVAGQIVTDTVWTAGIYLLTDTVTILPGVTLTIEPSVTVQFADSSVDLVVGGSLMASGTEGAPVIFQPQSGTAPGSWGRVAFLTGSTGILDNCELEYGGADGGMLYLASDLVQVLNSVVKSSSDTGIVIQGASPLISGTHILANTGEYGGGIFNDTGSPTISNNTIENNSARIGKSHGGGIYNFSGHPLIENNIIIGNYTHIPYPYGGGFGGGIYNNSGNPIIRFNIIQDNEARWSSVYDGRGGGIFNDTGSPEISDNQILTNTARLGGGIYNNDGNFAIHGNTFSYNSASATGGSDQGGGGIFNNAGAPLISDNAFSWNTGSLAGSGILNITGNPTIQSNIFEHNSAGRGGGIAIFSGSPVIENNVFRDNFGTYGGGIHTEGGRATIENNSFARNASTNGGAIFHEKGQALIQYNTLAGNTAGSRGGGIYHRQGSPVIRGNIIVGSSANWDESGIYSQEMGPVLYLDYNNVWNNTGGDYGGVVPGPHNISADPLFVDELAGDLRLLPGSPSVDAGDPLVYPQSDLDGAPRPMGMGPDMGAFEQHALGIASTSLPTTVEPDQIYSYTNRLVNMEAFGATGIVITDVLPAEVIYQGYQGDGLLCSHDGSPYGGSVTCTLDNLLPGDSITLTISAQVANGIFSPLKIVNTVAAATSGGQSAADLAETWISWCRVQLNDGPVDSDLQAAIDASSQADDVVKVSGRCLVHNLNLNKTLTLQGGWDRDFTAMEPMTYTTTLDARRLGRVIYISGSISPKVENFVITGGAAGAGAGIYSKESAPIISNNIIQSNLALRADSGGSGGGLFNHSGTPILTGNQILSNTANSWAGFYSNSGNPTIQGNAFRGNWTYYLGEGGGIFNNNDSPLIENNIFENNSSYKGGGIYHSSGDPVIRNNIFQDNLSEPEGGAICICGYSGNYTGRPIVLHNTFFSNTARIGGAIANRNGSLVFENNNVVGNSAVNGGGIYHTGFGLPALDSNNFWSNQATSSGNDYYGIDPGPHDISEDPLFVDSQQGNLHLGNGSPCIDAGSSDESILVDQEGDTRPMGLGPDIGADEFRGLGVQNISFSPSVSPGEVYSYTLEVGNLEPIVASNVVLTNVLPAEAQFLGYSGAGINCTHDGSGQGGLVTCTLGSFDPGQNRMLAITAVATTTLMSPRQVTNLVTVSSDNGLTSQDTASSWISWCAVRLNQGPIGSDIQGAINASNNAADVVKISGRCLAHDILINRNLTLQGGWDPDFTSHDPALRTTTLDAQRLGRVLEIAGNVTPKIENLTVVNGWADIGGGLFSETASPNIRSNIFRGNGGYHSSGGGIYISRGNPVIQNNEIVSNQAYESGAGIYAVYTNATIEYNTIAGNSLLSTSRSEGAGIYTSDIPKIYHNIIVSNSVAAADGIGGIYYHGVGLPEADYNNLWQNEGQSYSTAWPRANDISVDPRFADFERGDLHLLSDSLCIDAGDSLDYPSSDREGDLRAMGLGPDIGADEFRTLAVNIRQMDGEVAPAQTFTYTVHLANSDSQAAIDVELTNTLPGQVSLQGYSSDGLLCSQTQTGNLFCTLDALAPGAGKSLTVTVTAASSPLAPVHAENTVEVTTSNGLEARDKIRTWISWCSVRLNDGFVGSDVQAAINASTQPSDVIKISGRCKENDLNLDRNLTLQGGWSADFSTHDPISNYAILDAQKNGRILQVSGAVSPVIEDLIFIGGRGVRGGAIYNNNGSPTIRNNTFIDNRAYEMYGGGAISNHSGAPTIQSNNFWGNAAYNRGGAIANYSGDPLIEGNLFKENTSTNRGGGIDNQNGDPVILRNTFQSNAAYDGGGYYTSQGSSTVENNIFHGNTAVRDGGGVRSFNDSITMQYNTIYDNHAGSIGGGVRSGQATFKIIKNNIVVINTAPSGGGLDIYGSTVLDFNDVWGNTGGNYSGAGAMPGPNEISADPLFADLVAGDVHLTPGSPCIDAGDLSYYPATDIEGDPRPAGGAPDIGADEFVPENPSSLTGTDHSWLEWDADTGTYTRLYPDGKRIHFNPDGSHDYTAEPDGRLTSYSYHPDGKLASVGVVLPGEETPRWVWTIHYSDGSVNAITDPSGRTTNLTINRHNQLVALTDPDGVSRRYAYNPDGLMTQFTDENGHVTTYTYDNYGRVKEILNPPRAVYNQASGLTTVLQEVREFTPSDTGYVLFNNQPTGEPNNPLPPPPLSTDIWDRVYYGRGYREGHTNRWGYWLDETDGEGRTTYYQRDEANNLTRIDYPDGTCVVYAYDELGNRLSETSMPAEQCLSGVKSPEAGKVLTRTFSYDERFNQIKTWTDTMSQTITYIFDYEEGLGESGNLIRIEYPPVQDEDGNLANPTLSFSYNPWGQVETETDPKGTITKYVYTQGTAEEAYGQPGALFANGVSPVPGLLTQQILDYGGLNETTIFKDFDGAGNPQTVVGPAGAQGSTNSSEGRQSIEGAVAYYTYDAWGRILEEQDALGIVTKYEYDGHGNLIKLVRDYTADGLIGRNVTTYFAYDLDNRLLSERTSADGLEVKNVYQYDVNGQLAIKTDGNGNATIYDYDDADQLTSVTDPLGHTTTYSYTLNGQTEKIIRPDGSIDAFVYDPFGRVIEEVVDQEGLNLTTSYTYDNRGLVLSVTDPAGSVTCYNHDALRHRTAEILDCGGLDLTTQYAYDALGRLVYITDPRGTVTYREYDTLGRPTLVRQDDGGLNRDTSYLYDVAGNLVEMSDHRGVTTSFAYDDLNRQIAMCLDSSGQNLCTSYGYDRLGNQASTLEPGNIATLNHYNAFGLQTQAIQDPGGLTAVTSAGFDNALNKTSVQDSNGNVTQYVYDDRNQIVAESFADGTAVSYSYDQRGNLIAQTNQDGEVISIDYDADGRVIQRTFTAGGGGLQTYQYDPVGRLLVAQESASGHTSSVHFQYNAIGDVISSTQTLDGVSWLTNYSYDYLHGVYTTTYPSGVNRVQELDVIGRPEAVRAHDGTAIASYEYHDLDNYYTVAYANGLVNRFDFDNVGRTMRVSSGLADYRYGYNAAGDISFMQRWHDNDQPADVYQYDNLRQVDQVWYGADATDPLAITAYDKIQDFKIDTVSNRLEVDDGGVIQEYLPNNGYKLTNPMNRYETAAGNSIAYDQRGNMLADGANSYTYDIFNRQVAMSSISNSAEYIYDALGRRVAKIVNGTQIAFVYDNQFRVIEERASNGTMLARYTYGVGVDEPIAMERDGNIYYFHRDALGNITELSGSTGTLIEQYQYDIYGLPQVFDGSGAPLPSTSVDNPYLFAGRRFDQESGNYYFRARIYHPALGRFLQMDPVGNIDGMNRYNAYFVMKGSDPYGLQSLNIVNLPHAYINCGRFSRGGGACGFLVPMDLDFWFAKAALKLTLQVSYSPIQDNRAQCDNPGGWGSLWGDASTTETLERYTLSLRAGWYRPTESVEITFDLWAEAKLGASGLDTNYGYSADSYTTVDRKVWIPGFCKCYRVTAQSSIYGDWTLFPLRVAIVAGVVAAAAAAYPALAAVTVRALEVIKGAAAAAGEAIRYVPVVP